MNLDKWLTEVRAREGETMIRVTCDHGAVLTGLFMEYTDAFDNEEGIASIGLNVEGQGKPEVCVFDREIAKIEVVPKGTARGERELSGELR